MKLIREEKKSNHKIGNKTNSKEKDNENENLLLKREKEEEREKKVNNERMLEKEIRDKQIKERMEKKK